MPPSPRIEADIAELVRWCQHHADNASGPPPEPLPPHWFHTRRGQAWPHWMDMARHLFRHHRQDVQAVLKHALALHRERNHPKPGQPRTAPFQRPDPAHHPALHPAHPPEDILLYAASANGWPDREPQLDPHDLQTRLLWSALHAADHAAAHGPRTLERLDLTQMLVYQGSRHHGGLLLALHLQAVDSTPHRNDQRHDHGNGHSDTPDAGRLLPAPGAALLRTDALFHQGLQAVQTLLRQVLQPDAPAIAWHFTSLAAPGDSVSSVSVIEGPSAGAALAYGALYLLRHHLDTTQPHVAELARQLHTIEDPGSVSITAGLRPSPDPAQPWPGLHGVDGVPEKLAALDSDLPPGRQVPHRFVAQNQTSDRPILAHRAAHIGQLINEIARCTTSLGEDGQALHQALQAGLSDAAIAARPDLQQAMHRLSHSAPGQGVRAHLVWRYAQLCGGQPRAFGNVAQLGQHFVSLRVEGPRGPGADPTGELANNSLECRRLQDIFYPPPDEPERIARWQAVPGWVLLAPPFSGKTTLIHHWELTRIRAALRALGRSEPGHPDEPADWIEVPVFLPMNGFMRQSGPAAPSAEALGLALRQYARLMAPALPWHELLPEALPTPEQLNTPRRDRVRLRLCIDALNEYRTGQANEGSAISRLCDWLAPRCAPRQPGALLPPVFSVRREEAANFNLRTEVRPGWRAHEITVKPWRPSDMRAYVLQRRLPPAVQARLLDALQLPGEGADHTTLQEADDRGPANPLASFCQVPGYLSAQCTLLARWPQLQPTGRRAHLMLALAWHGLDQWQRSTAHADLQARAAQDPALAALLRWLLPETAVAALQLIGQDRAPAMHLSPGQAGGLLGGLARVADALQDPAGRSPEEAAPWLPDPDALPDDDGSNHGAQRAPGAQGLSQALVPELQPLLPPALATPGALQRLAGEWLAHASASGLATSFQQALFEGGVPVPWLRFAHQQLQEFFSALGVAPDRLPKLEPPPFEVLTKDLDDFLRKDGSKLEPPAVTPHTERLRYAADLATPGGAERLITAVLNQGNLALAAQLAIDQRARLEPPADASGRVVCQGHWRFAEHPHLKPRPLLQHLRARLLLAIVDTGAATRPKLHASGILAAIADTAAALPDAWRRQWAPLLPALRDPTRAPPGEDLAPGWPAPLTQGVDLRQRLQCGLLLGELGDNIRYERVPVSEDGRERVGIRLKAAHWAAIPGSDTASHRSGSDRPEDEGEDNHPAWVVPAGALPACRFAQTPAVVMQWRAYMEDQEARASAEPDAARRADLLIAARQPRALSHSDLSNPLQPITTLDWFTARAFTAWMAPLHARLFPELDGDEDVQKATLALPTEVQHEAAVRHLPTPSNPAQAQGSEQAWWPHDPQDRSEPGSWRWPGGLPPTLFNHRFTRWGAPAPVGVFSAALTPSGIEAMGNV